MYTYSIKYGIGKLERIESDKAYIYYEDEDKTMISFLKFVKFYETIEDAENAEKEIKAEMYKNIMADIEEEKKIFREGAEARAYLEERTSEMNRKLWSCR